MYKVVLITLYLISAALKGVTQSNNKVTGIYFNHIDFKNEKVSFPKIKDNSFPKIRLNDFFNLGYITVITRDSAVKFQKDSLFGFKMGIDSYFRIYKKGYYRIINLNDTVLIYKCETVRPITGRTNVTPYYYSIGLNSALKKLTKSNLKSEFIGNRELCKTIDTAFKYNTDLMATDDVTKQYKIIQLLKRYN